MSWGPWEATQAWSFEMTPFDRLHRSSYIYIFIHHQDGSTVEIRRLNNSNYGPILYHISKIKRDTGQKIVIFHIPPAFDVPVRGVPVVWCKKTRMAEISADSREAVAPWRRVRDDALYKWPRLVYFTRRWTKFEKMFTRFDTIHERGKRTDGHRTTAYAALCIASRGNNTNSKIHPFCW